MCGDTAQYVPSGNSQNLLPAQMKQFDCPPALRETHLGGSGVLVVLVPPKSVQRAVKVGARHCLFYVLVVVVLQEVFATQGCKGGRYSRG